MLLRPSLRPFSPREVFIPPQRDASRSNTAVRPYIAFAWAVIQLRDETCGFFLVTDPNFPTELRKLRRQKQNVTEEQEFNCRIQGFTIRLRGCGIF